MHPRRFLLYLRPLRAPARVTFYASGGPISSNSERNGEKNAAKNPWFLDFLPPLAAVRGFVRNVELTCSSERCRFCSEMRRCALLYFALPAAAGIVALPFHISGSFHLTPAAWNAPRTAQRTERGRIFKPQV